MPPEIAALVDEQAHDLGRDRMWRPTVQALLDDLAVVVATVLANYRRDVAACHAWRLDARWVIR
jgi:hypothetical protein